MWDGVRRRRDPEVIRLRMLECRRLLETNAGRGLRLTQAYGFFLTQDALDLQ